RRAARNELDVLPLHAGVGQRDTRRDHAVFHEILAPLAPGVHADAEDRDVLVHAAPPLFAGAHFHVSLPSVSGSSASSIFMPAFSFSTPMPSATAPSTIIFSLASSTGAIANGLYGSAAMNGSGGA